MSPCSFAVFENDHDGEEVRPAEDPQSQHIVSPEDPHDAAVFFRVLFNQDSKWRNLHAQKKTRHQNKMHGARTIYPKISNFFSTWQRAAKFFSQTPLKYAE